MPHFATHRLLPMKSTTFRLRSGVTRVLRTWRSAGGDHESARDHASTIKTLLRRCPFGLSEHEREVVEASMELER